MKKYQLIIILLNLAIILGVYHYFVAKKEETLSNGKLVLLRLAPVDPRSLMQGDYMNLRYEIAADQSENKNSKGYYVISLDSGIIAKRIRIQPNATPLHNGEYLIKYHTAGWQHSLGAEDYFFQEGQADKFANASFGGLMIDENGNSILTGLYDEKRKLIK